MFWNRILPAACLLTGILLTHGLDAAPAQHRLAKESAGEALDVMFPDGLSHDFGKVERGTPLTHTFRIVNTYKMPMRVEEVRASMSSLRINSTRLEIQPGEETELVVSVDTNRFVGARTQAFFVTLVVDGHPKTVRFWVAAFSQRD